MRLMRNLEDLLPTPANLFTLIHKYLHLDMLFVNDFLGIHTEGSFHHRWAKPVITGSVPVFSTEDHCQGHLNRYAYMLWEDRRGCFK